MSVTLASSYLASVAEGQGPPSRRPTCIRTHAPCIMHHCCDDDDDDDGRWQLRRRLAAKRLARRLGEGKVVEQPRVGMTPAPHVTVAGAASRRRGFPGRIRDARLTGRRRMARLLGTSCIRGGCCCCCWTGGVWMRAWGARWRLGHVLRGQQHGRGGPLTGGARAGPAARPAADLCADGPEEGVLGGAAAGGRARSSRVGRRGREHLWGGGARGVGS